MGAPQTLPADFKGWDNAPATLPANFNQWDGQTPAKPDTSGVLSEKGFGFQPSNPSTIPNARIRNYPNPAQNETSAAGAFYHGAKTGLLMGSLPFAADVTIPQAVGGLVGGTVAGVGAQQIAKSAGAGELGQEVSGDVGGLVGGLVGAGMSESSANTLSRVWKALPQSAKSDLLGVLSPRAAHVLRLANTASDVVEAVRGKPSLIPPEAPSPEMLQSSAAATSKAIQENPKAPISTVRARAAEIQQEADKAVGYQRPAPPAPGQPIYQRPAPNPENTELFRGKAQDVKGEAAKIEIQHLREQLDVASPDDRLGVLKQLRNAEDRAAGVSTASPESVPDISKMGRKAAMDAEAQAQVPAGHTAVDSSAVKSFKYDPKAQELDVVYSGGARHVYGDVSQAQADAFQSGDYVGRGKNDPASIGKALADIKKSGSVPVAKYVNGKRVALKVAQSEMDKIPEEEWQAGHELETEVEGTPR